MDEIRALLVDDEPLARRGLRQLLAPHRDVRVVGECRDGREALRALAALRPGLVFLDIQMPGLDGLEVVRAFGVERMPPTVFVTAHDAFAVRAFEAQALDYLVKPLSEARFGAALERVRRQRSAQDATLRAGRLAALLKRFEAQGRAGGERALPWIPVPTAQGERLLEAGEIEWIEADDDHAWLHVAAGRYRVRETLAALARRLEPSGFARIHRGALVRLAAVREWRAAGGGGAVLVLATGTELPVSRRRWAAVRAALRPR
jgi:two-component system LytT family response regulator